MAPCFLMSTLWVDFETRSSCDLKSAGVYNYAQHDSTDVICMSYAFDNQAVHTWRPGYEDFPARVRHHTDQIRAHNAAFERLIFWNVLGVRFDLEQFYCTATQARANCLPGSLEDVGRAVSSRMRKNPRGSQLIRLLCIPKAGGTFNMDATLTKEMIAYCEQDVRTMREISLAIRELADDELSDYHVSERINDRGVMLDKPLAEAAMLYAGAELAEIEALVSEITEGEITSVRSPKMRAWVQSRVGPEALKLMAVRERKPSRSRHKVGTPKWSIDKTVRANLLILAEENPDQVPPYVADVIQCADDLWASSVAKFSRLSALADQKDGRVRGAFVFAGGSATGRASSYGVQVHNFTRRCAKDPDRVRNALVRGHSIAPAFGKRVTDVLKGMLRPALIGGSGNVLVVADWAAIEARVNPWLSGEPTADAVLDVFRQGRDIYKREAAGIFHTPESTVDDAQRQIGKVAILACGFGGSVGAFAAMGRNYGILLPESDARRTVNAWRRANPWAVRFWQNLETAYTTALRHINTPFTAGRVTYLFDGQHLWYALPSGRVLCYPFAKLDADGVSYLKASWKPAADATEWPRARLWSGLACENITQAVANDLLRHSLRGLDGVVLHVHDEVVVECPVAEADRVVAEVTRVMTTPPDWAEGLPLSVGVKTMTRYGK